MARDASSTPGIGPTTGIMGGVLITANIGNTGTVTGAKASEIIQLSWLKDGQLNLCAPAAATNPAKAA